ncbi:hypothetical protein [Devosia sp. 63-57]|uniref:hypothetical protein n=1 Tax=Devosia sp. 63-57 TaxID=1895751 RepID=UPI00086882E1|nr:hypothetical protein [Devosia sp. 63-57]ODT49491.1 MAG: hypothetical protein ABS74_08280 [Pelagibacterium sp. SCN 63-126]
MDRNNARGVGMSSSQSRRLKAQVNVGLTDAEAQAIDAAARAGGCSRAAFVRRHVLSAVKLPETTRPRRYQRMTSADIEAVAALLSTLGRATGSTIQLSKALRRSGASVHHAEAEKVLSGLRENASRAGLLIERLSAER